MPQRFNGAAWEVGRCRTHPDAKRFSDAFARRAFERIRTAAGMPTLADEMADVRERRAPYVRPGVESLLAGILSAARAVSAAVSPSLSIGNNSIARV